MTTDTETNDTEQEAKPLPLREAVAERVASLQGGYLADRPNAVATLAQLRGGAGKLPADCPELWGHTIDLAECVYPRSTDEQAETAVHIAMTLYALHQQSRREDRMHQGPKGWQQRDLGWAIRELMPSGDIDEPLRKRFVQAGTATSIGVLAYRLRGIAQLLRREGIPLDYGLLADHLLTAQKPGGMRKVRGWWGRGFTAYRPAPPDSASDDQPASPDSE